MYEMSLCSNESSEYELNADTLDHLYKEQLQTLRELVFRQNHTNDIELCRKWLKIFSKTSKAEKMARNCLCSLMQQQLQELGALAAPFTNLHNCNRDLERVLRELDDQSNASVNYLEHMEQNPSTIGTFYHHCEHPSPPAPYITRENIQNVYGGGGCAGTLCVCSRREVSFNSCRGNTHILADGKAEVCCNDFSNEAVTGAGGDGIGIDELSIECEENEKQIENITLRRELETIRLQLMEKQIENSRLKEIAEKYQLENDTYEETFDNFKKTIAKAITRTLRNLNVDEQLQFPFKIFESIFRDFESDIEFFDSIKAFDNEFQQLLIKDFEIEINKRKTNMVREMCRKYRRSKSHLREKYERRLRMQKWAQKLQLKLVKLKCFSVLRQMFINIQSSKNSPSDNMWEMLRVLEEKYQAVVNEIF